jgi:hypothetical protein
LRTSHKRINDLIRDEKSKLTDEQIFASSSYAAYLTDIAEVASQRYKRKLKVKTDWNENPGADVAFTDNKVIYINCGNRLTAQYPTRELKSLSLIGFVGHEIGHILYTDFTSLGVFMQAVDNGTMYPSKPTDLEDEEVQNMEEYLEVISEKDEKKNMIIKYVLHSIANILEDVYIEERLCHDFPGKFKTAIRLNNVKLTEDSPSITYQVDNEVPNIAILINTILQYARIGDFNNDGGYKGELTDVFYDCMSLIDEVIGQTDARCRYDSANRILLKMWKYVKEWIEQLEKDPSMTPQMLEAMLDSLNKDNGGTGSAAGSALPSGTGTPVKGKYEADLSSKRAEISETQQILEEEGARIKLTKTNDIDEGDSGGFEYNKSYTGSGYENAVSDMNRLMNAVAEDRAMSIYNEELEDELQSESDNIRYGNAHSGIRIRVNRMASVPDTMRQSYAKVSPPLIAISKRLQRQIMQKLKSESEGSRMNGLYMGRRLNARAIASNDGKVFYNKKLPSEETKLALAVLVDESGSMSCNDRETSARAASIVLYDFCQALNIPLAMYGHTEERDVELYAYTEFDHPDKNDKFRIMDMSARSGNRDGAALRFVAERLSKRPEETKLLIIISDGQPAGYGYYGTEAEADLRGIKHEYKNKGVTMFAAAIGADKANIERIYKEGFLDITDLNKLPMNLTKLVLRYLKRM